MTGASVPSSSGGKELPSGADGMSGAKRTMSGQNKAAAAAAAAAATAAMHNVLGPESAGQGIQLKYGQTYMENFIEECGSLPYEMQRVLQTVKDLDERSAEVQAELNSLTTRCLELPPVCSRFVTREQAAQVAELRKRMEEAEALLATYSNEKVQLTLLAYEMVDSHINKCDTNLSCFEAELREMGEYVSEDGTGGDSDGSPAPRETVASVGRADRQHSNAAPQTGVGRGQYVRQKNTASGNAATAAAAAMASAVPGASGDLVVLKANSPVAAKVLSDDGTEQWILASVKSVSKDRSEVTVIDEFAEEGAAPAVYKLKTNSVIALPPKDFPGRALPVGSRALALYPGASVFYAATVHTTPRRTKGGAYSSYQVLFDDDAPEGMEIPARPVRFQDVVTLPDE